MPAEILALQVSYGRFTKHVLVLPAELRWADVAYLISDRRRRKRLNTAATPEAIADPSLEQISLVKWVMIIGKRMKPQADLNVRRDEAALTRLLAQANAEMPRERSSNQAARCERESDHCV